MFHGPHKGQVNPRDAQGHEEISCFPLPALRGHHGETTVATGAACWCLQAASWAETCWGEEHGAGCCLHLPLSFHWFICLLH